MDKISLPRHRIRDLFTAINQMDGSVAHKTDADGRSAFVREPYDLDGAAIYALARTQALIRPVISAFEDALKKLADKKGPEAEQEKIALAYGEEEVEVRKIPIVSLKIATNKIAPSVLRDLLPMIDGEL